MSDLFFGIPNGIIEGQCFENRMALVKAGLHRSPQRGIDGNKIDGTAAIVLSGGYEDDKDFGDLLIYTGEGGNDRNTKKQIKDQTMESPGNGGLVVCKNRKLPVRVIRGFSHFSHFSPKQGYEFAGLFNVTNYWEETGKSGFKICRFELKKIKDFNPNKVEILNSIKLGCLVLLEPIGKIAQWYGIGTEGPKVKELSAESNLVNHLIGKKVGDLIDFGSKFKVLEIKEYRNL